MKQTAYPLHRKSSWAALAVLGALGLHHAEGGIPEGLAQGAGAPTGPPVVSPQSPTAPPQLD